MICPLNYNVQLYNFSLTILLCYYQTSAKKTQQDEAKTELENLHLWMDASKLALNSTKPNVKLVNSKLRDKKKFGNIITENSEICITSTIKYLGIHIAEE